MPFDKLPYFELKELFKWLGPADRLRCTEVCRSWNEVISSNLVLTKDIKLRIDSRNTAKIRSMLQSGPRRHLHLVGILGAGRGSDGVIKLLTEISRQSKLEYLRLVGGFAPVHRAMKSISFKTITELQLMFLNKENVKMNSQTQVVVLETLKRFHCTQYSGSNTEMVTILRLVAPNLEQAVLILKDEGNFYDCEYHPLVDLQETSKLKHLEIDVNGNAWKEFFTIRRPLLEHFVLRQVRCEWQYNSWYTLFSNMPNLRRLAIVSQYFGPSERGIRHATLNYDVQMVWLNTDTLERLYLENVHIAGRDILQCNNLTELTCKNVVVRNAVFGLFAPELTRLSMRQCRYSMFKLRAGSQLQSMEIECFKNDCSYIEDFFDSLRNLRDLTLNIDEKTLKVMRELGTLPSLCSLNVVFHSAKNGSACNGLVRDICSNCPMIKSLTIQKKSAHKLHISDSSYRKLFDLRLQQLDVRDLTIPMLMKAKGRSRKIDNVSTS